MIKIHLSVILHVLDGFTGRPTGWGTLRCMVDGRPYRPMVKEGGTYLFLDLGVGEHIITLSGAYYRPETVRIEADCREAIVTMKPAANYPFGRQCPRLTLRLEEPESVVWMADMDTLTELKIAQSSADAGAQEMQLFCRESAKKLALPRDFLLADESGPEICRIEELGGTAPTLLARPLSRSHKRGCCLYPAQLYRADENGIVRAVFRQPCRVVFCRPDGTLVTAQMEMGENELTLAP